jgi:hypothetical protein
VLLIKYKKKLDKKEFYEQDILENREKIENKIIRNKKIYKIILGIVTAIIVGVVFYFGFNG